jgi:orotidine-5'-phosphate decarboxylase
MSLDHGTTATASRPACEFAIAYDVDSLERALELDARLGEGPEIAKIGLELFTAAGPDVVKALRARGRRVFLDLKLHDIPNTVAGAAAQAATLGAELLTVHAMGGRAMVAAAVSGVKRTGGDTKIVAVTELTSLDSYNLPPGFVSPFHSFIVVGQLLAMSLGAGAHGIVCSVADLTVARQFNPRPFYAVTPGIRPAGAPSQDQQRVATVAEAVAAGSSLIVLGRAVTAAADPVAALAAARAERDASLATLQK